MYCPNCGTQNEAGYRFCMKCGSPLAVVAPSGSQESMPEVSQTSQETTEEWQQPIYTPGEVPAPYGGSQQQKPPAQSPYTGTTSGKPQLYSGATGRQFQAPASQAGMSALHIWGPFAGNGARRRHVGWLLDNRGDKVEELNQKIFEKFSERSIPDTRVTKETLKGRGILVENRTYFLLRKGLVTTGLYVTKFGQDLYLSLVSYLKPPISNVRIVILAVMVLFWLYMSTGFASSLNNAMANFTNSLMGSLGSGLFGGNSGAPSSGGLATLLCVIGPLGLLNNLLLFLFIVYSLWKFLNEKDLLAGLRVTPNEFNEDDLMALEKAVEQTVSQSMDEIGLDFSLARQTAVPEGRII